MNDMFIIINIKCCFAIILLYVMIITLILMIIINSIIECHVYLFCLLNEVICKLIAMCDNSYISIPSMSICYEEYVDGGSKLKLSDMVAKQASKHEFLPGGDIH